MAVLNNLLTFSDLRTILATTDRGGLLSILISSLITLIISYKIALYVLLKISKALSTVLSFERFSNLLSETPLIMDVHVQLFFKGIMGLMADLTH